MRKKTGGYLTYLLHFSDVKIHYLQRENVKIKRDDDDTVRFLPCDLKVKSIIVVRVTQSSITQAELSIRAHIVKQTLKLPMKC